MNTTQQLAVAQYLSEHPSIVAQMNIQRDAADPSRDELCAILAQLLQRSPAALLERHGSLLPPSLLDLFSDAYKGHFEVEWHVAELRKSRDRTPTETKALRHNRRQKYLQDKLESSEYFDEDSIRRRAPELYHEYIGKYRDFEQPYDAQTPLSERLLVNMDLAEAQARQPEVEESDEDDLIGEDELDLEADKMHVDRQGSSDDEYASASAATEPMDAKPRPAKASPAKQKQNFDQLVDIMKRRFVDGQDRSFDYSVVDSDARNDDLTIKQQDDEDTYFATDD